MKFFENPKVKFLAAIGGAALVIAITGIILAVILASISYGAEKYSGLGLYDIDWLKTIITASVVALIFAAISIGAILICGSVEGVKALIRVFRKSR